MLKELEEFKTYFMEKWGFAAGLVGTREVGITMWGREAGGSRGSEDPVRASPAGLQIS